MARVFISHSSRDTEPATRMMAWLQKQGFATPFLDFDKHGGIPPGSNWERTLYSELATCEAVLIIQTSNWLASKWCFAEFTQARALGKPIFPVLEEPSRETLIAPDIQALDLRTDREGGLDRLSRELTRIALDAQGGFAWDPTRPPYPGLLAFQEEDAAVYFGRDEDIRRLIERLNARRTQGGSRLVALLGASGSGKSSLLRAGVIPRLKRDRRNWIVVPTMRPQIHPLDELARVMAIGVGKGTDWREFRDDLLKGGALRTINDWVHDIRMGVDAHDAQVLLAIDQAEELFGAADSASANRFADLLGAALAEEETPLMAIMALRSDFLESLQKKPPLAGKFEEFSLAPLPLARIPQIIEGPARVAGLSIDDGLVLEASRDAATEDALPLLAFALRELKERFGYDNRLTLDDYKALGDAKEGLSPLENAVRQAADHVLAAAHPGEAELRALREAFVPALVRVNDTGDYVRRPAGWNDLPAAAHDLLDRLVRARLLVARQAGNTRIVEVAHEALLRKWPQLRAWLDEEREFLIGKQQLEQDLYDWQAASDQNKSIALLTGLKLGRAESWLVERPHQLSPNERAFVRASLDRRKTEQRRRATMRWTVAAASLVAMVILTVVAIYASRQADRAEQQAVLARQEQAKALDLLRVARASQWQEIDTNRAALILAEFENPETSFATRMLEELLRLPSLHAELTHPSPATFVAFNQIGDHIVTIAEDHAVRLWGAATGRLAAAPFAHDGPVELAEISADGKRLLTLSDGTVRVWNVATGEVRQSWSHDEWVTTVALDPEGRTVAIAVGRELRLQEIDSGSPRFPEPWLHHGDVTLVAFAPRGDRIATVSKGGQIQAWDVTSGREISSNEPPSLNDVQQLRWAPSGTSLLAVGWDGWVVWDVESDRIWPSDLYGGSRGWLSADGRAVLTTRRESVRLSEVGGRYSHIVDHKGEPLQAAHFRQGHLEAADLMTVTGTEIGGNLRFSTYGAERSPTWIRLWRGENPTLVFAAPLAQDRELVKAEFDPTGRLLATLFGRRVGGGRLETLLPDATVRIWRVRTIGELPSVTLPGTEPAFDAGGKQVLTIEEYGANAFLFDTTTSEPVQIGRFSYDEPIRSAALSPDGARIAMMTDQALRIEDLGQGESRPLVVAPQSRVGAVSFSVDGRFVRTSSRDGVGGVWDAETGRNLLPAPPADCSFSESTLLGKNALVLLHFCGGKAYAWTWRDDQFAEPQTWDYIPNPFGLGMDLSEPAGLFAGETTDGVEIWDVRTGEQRHQVAGGRPRHIVFGPFGRQLALADEATVRLIDTSSGRERVRWSAAGIRGIAFAPGGRFLVTELEGQGRQNFLQVLNVDDGELRATIPIDSGFMGKNWTVATGDRMITWSPNDTRVWSIDTGEAFLAATSAADKRVGGLADAAISPDGAYLVTSTDKETRLWPISGRLLQQKLKLVTFGCLETDFRISVFGETREQAIERHDRCATGRL